MFRLLSTRIWTAPVKSLVRYHATEFPGFKSPRTAKQVSVKNLRRAGKPAFREQPQEYLQLKPCVTVSTAESYQLSQVIKALNEKGYHPSSLIPDEIISFKYHYNGSVSDVMVLQNGSIVAWGLNELSVREYIAPIVADCMVNPVSEPEAEDMDFVEVQGESFVDGDVLCVGVEDEYQSLLDKAAFASGISRSTRLAVLENALEQHIEGTRRFTESLSRGKKLNLTEHDVLMYTGRLFLIRGQLNLYSELIETPDLYWTEPKLEHIYKEVSKTLDISPRISILNKKLDYATDESRALLAVLNEQKSTWLEWIIIYLISVEVCFELYHFYERYWLDEKKST